MRHAPGKPGQARFYWPWASDPSRWAVLGRRPQLIAIPWQVLQPLAGIAALAFLLALLSLFGWLVPTAWMQALALVGTAGSLALYAANAGRLAIIPVLVDAVVLLGIFGLGWTPAGLAGD